MKIVFRWTINKIFALAYLLSLISAATYSREESLISPYIQLQYFKNSDNQSFLQTTLTYSANRMEIPLPGMEVTFYSAAGGKKLLSKQTTDENGITRFDLGEVGKLPTNNDGYWFFISEFEGNDTIEAANTELEVKDVNLEITLSEIDSIKTITLTATTIQKGRTVPVNGEVIMIYVPRMFSLLPISEATLDESGTTSVEFPTDLPGDSLGNLKIIARFEDNPIYGTVEKTVIERWGVPTFYTIPKIHRALWTKTPPMWMIVTLSILLAGVWGHYLFAVISLILIKIDAKREKDKKVFRFKE